MRAVATILVLAIALAILRAAVVALAVALALTLLVSLVIRPRQTLLSLGTLLALGLVNTRPIASVIVIVVVTMAVFVAARVRKCRGNPSQNGSWRTKGRATRDNGQPTLQRR